ncbi:hypothetical protein ACVXG7_09390 [Enterobacter hormaechei]
MKLNLMLTEMWALVENGMPVYIHDYGKEIPFDQPQRSPKSPPLNGEAKTHREAKEVAEKRVSRNSGITDPAKALEALETTTKSTRKN